uniref:Uncharacterized protein n=1 Tax=Anopheles atroparvus TaxID=41427 RepID=A0A182JBT8_ANOAO
MVGEMLRSSTIHPALEGSKNGFSDPADERFPFSSCRQDGTTVTDDGGDDRRRVKDKPSHARGHSSPCALNQLSKLPIENPSGKAAIRSSAKMQVESATKWRVPPLDLSAVSVLTNEAERRWAHGGSGGGVGGGGGTTTLGARETSAGSQLSKKIQYGADGLPIDPRDWTRANVWTWLINLAQSEGLDISPELAQKFPMNGKALCLMSLDMYLSRVPVGGKMLYRDFRVRLARAMSL